MGKVYGVTDTKCDVTSSDRIVHRVLAVSHAVSFGYMLSEK
jgi:hypothetical protein